MVGWKPRVLDPRSKAGEEEWSIDNGEKSSLPDTEKKKAVAEYVAGLLNSAALNRIKDASADSETVRDRLGRIYQAALNIEQEIHQLNVQPGTPLHRISLNTKEMQRLARSVIQIAIG